jgi:hypothetical protein
MTIKNVATLLIALAGSLILIAPAELFRLGPDGVAASLRLVGSIYGVALALWLTARTQLLGKRFSPPQRTFRQALFLAFLSSLPWSLVEVATAA